jgi:hypothetical protein
METKNGVKIFCGTFILFFISLSILSGCGLFEKEKKIIATATKHKHKNSLIYSPNFLCLIAQSKNIPLVNQEYIRKVRRLLYGKKLSAGVF